MPRYVLKAVYEVEAKDLEEAISKVKAGGIPADLELEKVMR